MITEARAMLRRADRHRSSWSLLRYVPNPKTTPFTFGYLVVLLGTTLVLEFADPALTDRLLQLSSTDAHNLWRRPLASLLTSAIWLPGESWFAYAAIFAVAVAPLERRFGVRRTALVFFAGHIVATLVTELPVMALISAHVLPASAGHWLDIGVSYGFFTTAGALVFLLHGRMRLLALAAMEAFVAVIWLGDDPASLDSIVTLLGHAFAAHFGLLVCGPWLRASIRRPEPNSAG
ncbi:rhomboid-like protein [Amycolatopsis sp.]|uniref:rhomboid-like protein n=1 Tax=Amycolatopsis sp. TaxID=37632 RepID=UPI002D7FFF1D|nr:rhomboid-like protein [Amycolatopsis sp.]HET6712051.1 rhomboid-like protein [Amycolatopsis sp.]